MFVRQERILQAVHPLRKKLFQKREVAVASVIKNNMDDSNLINDFRLVFHAGSSFSDKKCRKLIRGLFSIRKMEELQRLLIGTYSKL